MADWVFDLDKPDTSRPKAPVEVDEFMPLVGERSRWEQFSDPVVYELDVLMRDWLEKMCSNKKWCRSRLERKYTFSMIFEQLFGRPYDQAHGDAVYVAKLSKIITWYSSRIQKGGRVGGRNRTKTIYTISPSRYRSRWPYSLKLRLKWFGEQGIVPTHSNMRLPNDRLKPGHARNPRTDANMEERRRQGRERYNERYRDRAR